MHLIAESELTSAFEPGVAYESFESGIVRWPRRTGAPEWGVVFGMGTA